MSAKVYIAAMGMLNALGGDTDAVAAGLFAGCSAGLVLESGWLPSEPARVGRVATELPSLPDALAAYDCRNNRLLLAAYRQIEAAVQTALARYGRRRVGVVLGTSTSGIAAGEQALAQRCASGQLPAEFNYAQQEIGRVAPVLAELAGIAGPAYTVSTACTSSAKAFASARLLLRSGICDAVVVGGVDSLCRLTLNGFAALESTSVALCNPLSANRCGINIGEGAALFLLTREAADIELLGIGETSDAYHMSAPRPDGAGAEAAMRAALRDARLTADDIDYLNLHATATHKNDEMESRAVAAVFAPELPVSGTKPLTGHLLGAAGATEIGFCVLALQRGLLPPHVWDGVADPALPQLATIQPGQALSRRAGRACMSTSFAFGGSNVSVIVGDAR